MSVSLWYHNYQWEWLKYNNSLFICFYKEYILSHHSFIGLNNYAQGALALCSGNKNGKIWQLMTPDLIVRVPEGLYCTFEFKMVLLLRNFIYNTVANMPWKPFIYTIIIFLSIFTYSNSNHASLCNWLTIQGSIFLLN